MLFILLFIFGTIIGSFLNLIAGRVPLGLSIIQPRSHCQHCGKPLKNYDLVPLLSVCLLKGKCRFCKYFFGWDALLTELICGLLFSTTYLCYGLTIKAVFYLLLSLMGVTLALTDIFYLIVEPKIMYTFSAGLLVFHFILNHFTWNRLFEVLFLWVVFVCLGKLLPNQLGDGDVLLLLIWCFFLGLEQVLIIILWACVSALGFLGIKIYRRTFQRFQQLAFVPFLTFGLIISTYLWPFLFY